MRANFMLPILTAVLISTAVCAQESTSQYDLSTPKAQGSGAGTPSILTSQQVGISLDGINDYVQVPDDASLDVDTAFTLEAWINPAVINTSAIVTKFGDGSSNRSFALLLLSSGALEFSFSTDGVNEIYMSTANSVSAGVWTHVAAVYDGSMMRVYFNGIEDAVTNPVTDTVFNSAQQVSIGARDNGSLGLWYNGLIDEVRIWHTGRTTQEINDHKNCVLSGLETGLAAYYTFDNGSAGSFNASQVMVDSSPNGNNGQAVSMALSGSSSNYVIGATDSVPGPCTPPVAATASVDNIADCAFTPNGAATASASLGMAPYTFSWSNGSSDTSLSNVAAGTYTVTIVDALGNTATDSVAIGYDCAAPMGLKEWNIQDSSVVLRWDTTCGATAYRVRYRVAGSSQWNLVFKQINHGNLTISGLSPNTKYRWNVVAKCGNGWGKISSTNVFSTLSAPCAAPTALSTQPVQTNQARLNWQAVATAKRYSIRWREVGGNWTKINKDNSWTKHWLTGLSDSTTYQWQIKTQCGASGATPWSPIQSFTTAPVSKTLDNGVVASQRSHIEYFPNPSTGQIIVQLSGNQSRANIAIFSLTGQLEFSEALNGNRTIDLSTLSAGTYILQIVTEETAVVDRLILLR